VYRLWWCACVYRVRTNNILAGIVTANPTVLAVRRAGLHCDRYRWLDPCCAEGLVVDGNY
jgi:hypothetical protein